MKSMNTLISIIIPCYNSACFVSNIIEMLFIQGLDDCELILVDDGSNDNTLEVLQRYVNKANVKVLHQENAGVSVARNIGLAAATGRYVYFLDSDDTLAPGSISFFKQQLRLHSTCQMFIFGYEMRKDGIKIKSYLYPAFDNQEFDGKTLTQNYLIKKFCVHICSSIYERSFLLANNLCFTPGMRIGEDLLFIHQVMLKDRIRIYYSSRVCFVYQLRFDSATQAYRSFSEDQYIAVRKRRDLFFEYCSTHSEMKLYVNFFMSYIYLTSLCYYLRSDIRSSQINTWFCEDAYLRFLSFPYVSLSLNFLLFISRFIPIRLILNILK